MLLRRGLALAAAAAGLVVAGAAVARTVSTGDHARFVRDVGAGSQVGYWASNLGSSRGDEIQIIIYPSRRVRVGDRFDLYGRTAAVGRAEVIETTETKDSCPLYPYLTARARVIEGKLDQNGSQMVAVTPPGRGRLKGKAALAYYDPIDSTSMPPPGETNSRMYAIDTDGDDDWDLVRYMYNCSDGVSGARYSGTGEGCVEDWSREKETWLQRPVIRVQCR